MNCGAQGRLRNDEPEYAGCATSFQLRKPDKAGLPEDEHASDEVSYGQAEYKPVGQCL
jgi:hypothetical protein